MSDTAKLLLADARMVHSNTIQSEQHFATTTMLEIIQQAVDLQHKINQFVTDASLTDENS